MAGSRTFTFLGTGTSVGVPMIGCECETCRSTNPRNNRYRCSVLISTQRGSVLIDTTPELRLQLLRERVPLVHAVLYTHYHADHMMGLDDLRLFPRALGGPLPIYCTEEVEQVVRRAFPYAFSGEFDHLPLGAIPRLTFRRIEPEVPFSVLGHHVVPVPLQHAQYNVLGFRFDDVAYCTDVNQIAPESYARLEGLRVLVIDALRPRPHPAHLSLDEALAVIERLKPGKAYLTHMAHEMNYDRLNSTLPPNVEMAYDGLKFTF
ncbi:MAG: MBL fold metallo-hydrolase [Gemmataceae bacterium]